MRATIDLLKKKKGEIPITFKLTCIGILTFLIILKETLAKKMKSYSGRSHRKMNPHKRSFTKSTFLFTKKQYKHER